MNYELQIKLINAGWDVSLTEKYPELSKKEYYERCSLCGDGGMGLCKSCVIRRYMNLSNLIETCGTRFFGLFKCTAHSGNNYCWKAEGLDLMGNLTILSSDNKTPEEAVANLWLELKHLISINPNSQK